MEHTDFELYIQIQNGEPFEHPIFADNFKHAFPDVDANNLPADRFARFIRVSPPKIGVYEVCEGPTYQWVDGIVKDTYVVRPMTDEERAQKDADLKLQKENEILGLHRIRVETCRKNSVSMADPIAKQLWADCLAAHEAWTMENADPITPPFPLYPRQDESGSWFAP